MFIFKRVEGNSYSLVRSAGRGLGPRIADFINETARKREPSKGEPLEWELGGADLRRRVLNDDERREEESYKLIADVLNVLGKENRRYAQLFEVHHVWGFSSFQWTPMMWKLSLVCEAENCAEYRSRNLWPFEPGDEVYEFLRLGVDHTGGRKRDFGPVGRYNGVLLWPDALRYFFGHLSRSQR